MCVYTRVRPDTVCVYTRDVTDSFAGPGQQTGPKLSLHNQPCTLGLERIVCLYVYTRVRPASVCVH